jgi:hypothetical protein
MTSAYLFAMLAVTPSESREIALIANPEFEAGRVAGHRARRLIDGGNPALSDPFLVMAEDWVPRDAFSRHPHRGIETVTLMLDGALGRAQPRRLTPSEKFVAPTPACSASARAFAASRLISSMVCPALAARPPIAAAMPPKPMMLIVLMCSRPSRRRATVQACRYTPGCSSLCHFER